MIPCRFGGIVLYRGMIYLDLWLFTSSMMDHRDIYLMIYLTGLNAFTGLVEVLRSREERSVGMTGWKYRAAYGGACLLSAAAVYPAPFPPDSPDDRTGLL